MAANLLHDKSASPLQYTVRTNIRAISRTEAARVVDWQHVFNGVSAFSTAALALLTIAIAVVGVKQVKVSQAQVQQALEARYDSQSPLLVPQGNLPVGRSSPDDQDNLVLTFPSLDFGFHNAGPGIALNIRGVIFGTRVTKGYAQRYSLWSGLPLKSGATRREQWKLGGSVLPGTARIVKHGLHAPPTPSMIESQTLDLPRVVGRCTLTYHDVFGRKHAGIFDYTDLGDWRTVAFLHDIPMDLEDLDREARRGH